ncbi:MAG: alcohol dehydrogenase catalytic domain-containing protein [Spirochaetes bacterium]|nr:alcohol dehydrogenase catalytic domain-containing protein [Spirochaetota bacterium]
MTRKTLAAVLRADGTTPLETIELPERQPGDLLVRLRACGVCTGEAMRWYTAGKTSAILGHEVVAEVLEGGEGTAFKPGDRIFPHHHAPCGECEACRGGHESSCDAWKKSRLVPGGYAREFIVPAWNARRDTRLIPPALSDDAAIFIEPVACVVRALHKASGTLPSPTAPSMEVPAGGRGFQRIAILGLGFMAQLCARLFKERFPGARIAATELIPERREQGRALGLHAILDASLPDLPSALARELGGEPELVVVCPSSARAVAQGLSLAAPGGRVVLFAPPAPKDPVAVDFNRLYFRETSIVSAFSCGPADVLESLLWCQRLASDFEGMISHRWPLDRVGEALSAIAAQDPGVLKVVVRTPPGLPLAESQGEE